MVPAEHHFTHASGEPHYAVAVPVNRRVRSQSLTRAVETLRPGPLFEATYDVTHARAMPTCMSLTGRIFSERALLVAHLPTPEFGYHPLTKADLEREWYLPSRNFGPLTQGAALLGHRLRA